MRLLVPSKLTALPILPAVKLGLPTEIPSRPLPASSVALFASKV